MNKKLSYILYTLAIAITGYFTFYLATSHINRHKTVHYATPIATQPILNNSTLNFGDTREMREYTEQDKEFIKQQFKENWALLISSPDYDIDDMLTTNSPHVDDFKHRGKLITKVLYYNGERAGFGSCYMDTNVRGDILFVEVDKNFRGKRLAETIVNTQVEDLKKLGATTVKLATRTDNFTAQKVYTRLGFTETHRSKTHVYYRKDL